MRGSLQLMANVSCSFKQGTDVHISMEEKKYKSIFALNFSGNAFMASLILFSCASCIIGGKRWII
jgi:hypothetical protein